jgi:integrase
MDTFGPMRMIEILPSHVREWVKDRERGGMSSVTLRMNKTILSSIFTTALNDQVTALHPCRGVRTPPVPKKPLRIITPAEFDTFYSCLPDDVSRLLVETGIASGMRWGELAELRPKDLELGTRIVTVSRTVVELNARYHPDGEHFLLKEYPKDREWRRIKLGAQIMERLGAFIEEHGIGVDDLIFGYAPTERAEVVDRSEPTGVTTPNAKGRQYRHGTLSGYSAGQCRCANCRRAYAVYRATRRAAGADQPRLRRRWKSDGHIPRRWFRDSVLKPAFARSGIDVDVKMHALRHAHASWLLAGGADLQVVRDRLGHGSIATTERHLHTLPDADDTAVEALMKIRGR